MPGAIESWRRAGPAGSWGRERPVGWRCPRALPLGSARAPRGRDQPVAQRRIKNNRLAAAGYTWACGHCWAGCTGGRDSRHYRGGVPSSPPFGLLPCQPCWSWLAGDSAIVTVIFRNARQARGMCVIIYVAVWRIAEAAVSLTASWSTALGRSSVGRQGSGVDLSQESRTREGRGW